MTTIEKDINNFLKVVFDEFEEIGNRCIQRFFISDRYILNTALINTTPKGVVKKRLSNKEIINITREVLSDIDESLVKEFDKFVLSKKIKIKKSEVLDLMNDHNGKFIRKKKRKKLYTQKIELYKEPNYTAVTMLIHEFMHSTNHKFDKVDEEPDEKYILRKEFTEFISIYFEMYSRELMQKKYGLSNNMFNISQRFKSNKDLAVENVLDFLPFFLYKKYGEISFETFSKALSIFYVPFEPTEEIYNIMLESMYKFFDNGIVFINSYKALKDEKKDVDNLQGPLRILLGMLAVEKNYVSSTLLYYSVKDRLTPKDILNFNDIIASDEGMIKCEREEFKKVFNYYKELHNDEIPFNNLVKELKTIYDKDGKVKNYKL